jgi:hypothetical protein
MLAEIVDRADGGGKIGNGSKMEKRLRVKQLSVGTKD